MFNPGANQLAIAMRTIAPQTVQYYQYNSRVVNEVGEYQTYYNPPFSIRGSLQAVNRNLVKQHGLDWQKDYVVFYANKDLLDVARDVSNDKIIFGVRQFDVLSSDDWYTIDAWASVLCVEVKDNPIFIIE